MQIELKVPEIGESVQEAILAEWYKGEGEQAEKDEPVFVIETDKVTLEVVAPETGKVHILVEEGETVTVDQVVGTIDTGAAETATEKHAAVEKTDEPAEQTPPPAEKKPEPKPAQTASAPSPVSNVGMMPSAARLVAEKGIDPSPIQGTGLGGRITRSDVVLHMESGSSKISAPSPDAALPTQIGEEAITRKPMSPIRKSIAKHLLAAKQNTAMLTTFNEIDMGRVMAIRNDYKDAFFKKNNVRLGFMSFFIKAVVSALKEHPDMNAKIDGDHFVYHHYYHIGVAIGAERGLVVPVIRHADKMTFAELEAKILEFVDKIKTNRLTVEDLSGGTFSVTNGGVYGSLLSTPILNMPQSGILGMHKIEDRPVVIKKEIVIRPMMYVAMSYDHRIVDGKTAVTFLRRIKEFMENPERIMMEI